MKRFFLTLPLCLALLAGCKHDENPIAPETPHPAFVVNAMSLTATVGTDAHTGAPATFIHLTMSYQFSGKPGTLDGISVRVGEVTIAGIFEPLSPSPIGSPLQFDHEFRFQDEYPGMDSIFVRLGVGGRFWDQTSRSPNAAYHEFSRDDSLWVKIAR